MAETPEVRGFAEVLGRLASVSTRMRRTVSRKVVVAGARVIANQARRNAPRRTGTLQRAIFGHYSPKRSRRDTLAVALVRARSGRREANRTNRRGKRLASRDAFYAGWVEFGHDAVPRGSRGRGIAVRRRNARIAAKRVQPRPFLGPAYQSAQQPALAEMERVARLGLGESAR